MKKLQTETRIFIILALAFIFVALTGIAAYRNFTVVVDDITNYKNPGMQMIMLESLRSSLADAESSVKSYNLTRDADYLTPYTNNIDHINELMDSIKIKADKDATQKALADSLRTLVQQKEYILRNILLLKNNESVTEELNRIDSKLEQALAIQKVEKSKKLFKSKEEKAKIKAQKEAAKPENIVKKLKQEVGSEIGVVKQDQVKQLKDIKLDEFSLLMSDKEVMFKIKDIIFQLQEIEKKEMIKDTLDASELAAETNKIIAYFCLLATLLMMLAVYVVISYLDKNKKYNAELTRAKNETEKLAKAKESFLYNMGHEIRTPMNAVIGFIDILKKSKLDKEQTEQVNVLKRSSDHLMQILNDILDISKINAGKFTFTKQAFSLKDVLADIQAAMEKVAIQKGLKFQFQLSGNIPAHVNGDPVRLRQILYNLIDNAIKYTPKGSVNILVNATTKENNQSLISFEVADTGVGIQKENLERIFNEFEQDGNSDEKFLGGTGLGLSITKNLVELQNGQLSIESEPEKGTKIAFNIPYETIQENQLPKETSHQNHNLSGIKILVADDVELNRQLIQMHLNSFNAEAKVVANGKDLLKAFEAEKFDIIFVDIRMPEMSGTQVCKHIRSHASAEKANIPLIALTAIASQEDIDQYLKTGFSGVLIKPYSVDNLLEIINKNVKIAASPQKSAPSVKGTLQVDIYQPENRDLVELFVSSTSEDLAKMYTLLQSDENPKAITEITHKLIPGCKMFHAPTLADFLFQLEKEIKAGKKPSALNSLTNNIKTEENKIMAQMQEILGENATVNA